MNRFKFKRLLFVALVCLIVLPAWGQRDSSWSVLLLQKGTTLNQKPDMASFSKDGFYLYRNCVYEVDLKNKAHLSGRLIDIKPDTLFFTNYLNEAVAIKALSKLDTVAVCYKDLDKLNLISDRSFGFYIKHSFKDFEFHFRKDTASCILPSVKYPIYANDSSKYELVPHLTSQGVSLLYEENGGVYYFYGAGMINPDPSKIDRTYRKERYFWLTPCRVEEINGFALGFHTKNIKNDAFNERDSLVVRGLSLELNPAEIFTLMAPHLDGPYPDSIRIYRECLQKDWRVKILGLHISAVSTINEAILQGLNLTGAITVIDEMHGVSISGVSNFCYILNGVAISALRNRATVAKGVQVGLINKATELRGFQIGLWNTNGKRSLPIINWQFRSSK